MTSKSTAVPNFKSDREEADWYATSQGRRQTQRGRNPFAEAVPHHNPQCVVNMSFPKPLRSEA